MTEIISLKDAKAKGLQHYFTGVPCRNGHVDLRGVSNRGCVVCNRNRVKQFEKRAKKENPNYRRVKRIKATYGLTETDLQKMLSKQHNACFTCQTPFVGQPHIDHDHTTGAVRGLLCGPCNRALGMVKDNVITLQRMISYLHR